MHKTRNTEMGNGMRGMLQKIPGNVREDSGECSRGSRGMFEKIPGNVPEDSGECYSSLRLITYLLSLINILLT